jgi:hypothetical protein
MINMQDRLMVFLKPLAGGIGQTQPPNNTISLMTKQTEPLCYDCDVTGLPLLL